MKIPRRLGPLERGRRSSPRHAAVAIAVVPAGKDSYVCEKEFNCDLDDDYVYSDDDDWFDDEYYSYEPEESDETVYGDDEVDIDVPRADEEVDIDVPPADEEVDSGPADGAETLPSPGDGDSSDGAAHAAATTVLVGLVAAFAV